MPHLYVIAGHGAGDSGAVGHGYQEQERVRALASEMHRLAPNSVTLHPFSDNAFESRAIERLDIPKDWHIVEEHMDSAGPSARGATVIKGNGVSPSDYDRKLATAMSSIFPGRSNPLKNQALANATRSRRRGYDYRLVENGFISNKGDIDRFNRDITRIAKAQLNAFGIGADEMGLTDTIKNYHGNDVTIETMLRAIDEHTDKTFKETTRTDDPSGRNVEMTVHDHLKWMAAKQKDMDDKMNEILELLKK